MLRMFLPLAHCASFELLMNQLELPYRTVVSLDTSRGSALLNKVPPLPLLLKSKPFLDDLSRSIDEK